MPARPGLLAAAIPAPEITLEIISARVVLTTRSAMTAVLEIGRASGRGDWSSDVCSSDLNARASRTLGRRDSRAGNHIGNNFRARGVDDAQCDDGGVGVVGQGG